MPFQFADSKCSSHSVIEEHIPLIIKFDTGCNFIRYVEFYHENTDVLELALDSSRGVVNNITLVLCHHYSIYSENLDFREYCSEVGTLILDAPRQTKCETFYVMLFDNGIKITVSENSVETYYQMGSVFFGFDKDGNLVEILCKLDTESQLHCKKELEFIQRL